jgi:hypothetical protein
VEWQEGERVSMIPYLQALVEDQDWEWNEGWSSNGRPYETA